MPRVLLVSYPWLPAFSSGVRQAATLSRYLPDAGWDPIILSRDWTDGPAPEDDALGLDWDGAEGALPLRAAKGLPVVKVPFARRENAGTRWQAALAARAPGERAWSPRGIARRVLAAAHPLFGAYPDAFRGWVQPAVLAGLAAVRQSGIGAVVSVSPPDSAHVAAGEIARQAGIPWIPVFGALGAFYTGPGDGRTKWQRLEHRALMRRWLRGASRAAAATPAMAAYLSDAYGLAAETLVLPFDPEERRVPPRRTPAAPLRLVHVGRVAPETHPIERLLEALDLLIAREPSCAASLRVELVGSGCEDALRARVAGRPSAAVLHLSPRVSPADAVARQREADGLLLLEPTMAPGEPRRHPATLFEQLNARRPIIALASEGGFVDQVLAETRGGDVASDATALALLIQRALDELSAAGELGIRSDDAAVARYGGPEQARKLAVLLDAASAGRFGSWQRS